MSDWIPPPPVNINTQIQNWTNRHLPQQPQGFLHAGVMPANTPELLLQTELIQTQDQAKAGSIITAVAIPWLEIRKEIAKDPEFLVFFSKNPRKFEEFIAGAYDRAGWDEVILTPRSADGGRDVIATKYGLGSLRFLDQAKAYRPGYLVTHNDLRAMLGVLTTDTNSSKGLITTTSDFAPTITSGSEFQNLMPYRLELRNGRDLMAWLDEIGSEATPKS